MQDPRRRKRGKRRTERENLMTEGRSQISLNLSLSEPTCTQFLPCKYKLIFFFKVPSLALCMVVPRSHGLEVHRSDAVTALHNTKEAQAAVTTNNRGVRT